MQYLPLEEEGRIMQSIGRLLAGLSVFALLTTANLGCSALQPQDTWTSAANSASQAASQAGTAAGRAEAAAGQAEAAAGRSETAASRAEEAAQRAEDAAARVEAMFDRMMRK